jgi:uncharacterized sulfatase
VPAIARWPGTIPAGSTSGHVAYFGDVFATACELTGAPVPNGLDSISFLPTLAGQTQTQKQHDYLYWEFYEQGGRQAVRFGDWKAIREPMITGNVQLFDLSGDLGESTDLAVSRPDIVRQAVLFLNEAHVSHPDWTVRGTR